jgi:hypothetical protein
MILGSLSLSQTDNVTFWLIYSASTAYFNCGLLSDIWRDASATQPWPQLKKKIIQEVKTTQDNGKKETYKFSVKHLNSGSWSVA